MKLLNKDRIFSIGLILLSLYVLYLTANLESLYAVATSDPGPKFFPTICCVAIILCSIGKFVTAKAEDEQPFLSRRGWIKLMVMFVAFGVYILSMTYLGFLISTPLFTALFVYIMSGGKPVRPVRIAAFSLCTTGLLFIIFEWVISVILPRGILF